MKKLLLTLFISLGLIGCTSNQMFVGSSPAPMPVVDYVDLDRFMGDWYVIATIPTFLERDAYNPIETYTSVIMMEVLQRLLLSIKVV